MPLVRVETGFALGGICRLAFQLVEVHFLSVLLFHLHHLIHFRYLRTDADNLILRCWTIDNSYWSLDE